MYGTLARRNQHRLGRKNNFWTDFFDSLESVDTFDTISPITYSNSIFTSPAKCDTVVDKEDRTIIELAAPGAEKENIMINLDTKGVLDITIPRSKQWETGQFKETITKRYYVSEGITEEDIEAKYNSGILKITVLKPKQQIPEKKKIPIT